MMKNIFGKIPTTRIGKYFYNLLYGYIRFYQGNDGIFQEDYIICIPNEYSSICQIQKYYLISKLQFNATQ